VQIMKFIIGNTFHKIEETNGGMKHDGRSNPGSPGYVATMLAAKRFRWPQELLNSITRGMQDQRGTSSMRLPTWVPWGWVSSHLTSLKSYPIAAEIRSLTGKNIRDGAALGSRNEGWSDDGVITEQWVSYYWISCWIQRT
jgi:hypothetical protein